MELKNFDDYSSEYKKSIQDKNSFWLKMSNRLNWIKKPTYFRELHRPPPQRKGRSNGHYLGPR